ncbi:MAG: AarF/ABC1/UbiB kinase family protein [Anaerolineae bacterium]|nr:AarF/ABC1/UbiB kinase family protein [Anaerolineae bacterium]
MLNNLPPIRNLRRWRELQAILFRYGFDFLTDIKEVRSIQQTLKTLNLPFSLPESRLHELSTPERVRRMLQDLGPTYVKLGQILSSRSDLLPESWVVELAKLQDSVPPFSFEIVENTIREELGSMEEIFLFLDPEPIAAASIGQVHYAILKDFSQVVVKVQRPNVEEKIQSDLEFVRDIAKLMHNSTDWGKKYGVVGIAEELIRTLMDELDYNIEATNADRLRRNMERFDEIHVPVVYWPYTTKRVLTMEAIDGFKINDIENIATLDLDRQKVSKIFIHSILHQAFINGFFHADPHPGNLMIEKKTNRLVYLDTGMMGSLLPEQRDQLGEVVQAIIRRDTETILRLALKLGVPFQPVNERKLRRDMDHMINQYLEAPLDRLEISRLLTEVLTMIFESGIRLPPVLGVSAKALLQAEDVARTLNPDIVVVEVMQDVSYQVYLNKINPGKLFWSTTGTIRDFQDLLRMLPRAVSTILADLQKGELKVGIEITDLKDIIGNILIIANRLIVGLVLIGMIIGSALAMGVSPRDTYPIVPIMGMIGFFISIVVAISMFLQVWSAIGKARRFRRLRQKNEELRRD